MKIAKKLSKAMVLRNHDVEKKASLEDVMEEGRVRPNERTQANGLNRHEVMEPCRAQNR